MIKIIVFDFDGVIIDSNHIKCGTYYQLFDNREEIQAIITEVLNSYPRVQRKVIFRKILERLIKEGFVQENEREGKHKELVDSYGRLTEEGVMNCQEIKGAVRSIKKLCSKYRLYVNSLNPVDQLRRLLVARNLLEHFKGIYGAEKTKTENLKTILEKEQVLPKETVVVGDGGGDFDAARDCGTHFIGIDHDDGAFKHKNLRFSLPDCTRLYDVIEELNQNH